jgi:hypothetical protein
MPIVWSAKIKYFVINVLLAITQIKLKDVSILVLLIVLCTIQMLRLLLIARSVLLAILFFMEIAISAWAVSCVLFNFYVKVLVCLGLLLSTTHVWCPL